MFETIVWATDGSELADRALPHVMELARTHHSKIVVVHANQVITGRFGGAPMLADETELLKQIEAKVAEIDELGLDAELKVVNGSFDTAILVARAAKDVEADLIVVGTHGRGGFRATMLGSVARGLLHEAKCPVLAVPPETRVPVTA